MKCYSDAHLCCAMLSAHTLTVKQIFQFVFCVFRAIETSVKHPELI